MKSARTTSEILTKYINDILEVNKIHSGYASYMLEFIFGEEIHTNILGFINFMESEKNKSNPTTTKHDIRTTLVHDLAGALKGDKLMLPRVSEYGKYA